MEKLNLRIFWGCMLVAASLALIGIWFGENFPETYFKTIATFVIIGLANFLLWVPQVAYRFLQATKHSHTSE